MNDDVDDCDANKYADDYVPEEKILTELIGEYRLKSLMRAADNNYMLYYDDQGGPGAPWFILPSGMQDGYTVDGMERDDLVKCLRQLSELNPSALTNHALYIGSAELFWNIIFWGCSKDAKCTIQELKSHEYDLSVYVENLLSKST